MENNTWGVTENSVPVWLTVLKATFCSLDQTPAVLSVHVSTNLHFYETKLYILLWTATDVLYLYV